MQKLNLWPSGITQGKSITAANPTDILVWAEVVDQLPDQRNHAAILIENLPCIDGILD